MDVEGRRDEGTKGRGSEKIVEGVEGKGSGGMGAENGKRLRSRRTRFVGICGVEVLDEF